MLLMLSIPADCGCDHMFIRTSRLDFGSRIWSLYILHVIESYFVCLHVNSFALKNLVTMDFSYLVYLTAV